ncbi:RNA-directed DNA polymerase, eukaryota [Tanacetum coccineum]
MFRGGRGFVLVCECEWKWGVSVVGLVVMGSAGGGFSGDGGAGDGEVVVELTLGSSTLLTAYKIIVSDERVVWVDIEGIPLHVWSRETFAKIGNKWGEALDIEDNFGSSFARKRLCQVGSALCLDRHFSDHRLILLREVLSDFGLTPFRFYQSWLRMEGFDSMVEHAWLSFSHSDSNAMVRFKKKLQDIKSIIVMG